MPLPNKAEYPVHGEHVPVDGAAGVPAGAVAAAVGIHDTVGRRVGQGYAHRRLHNRQSQMGKS